MTLQLSELRKGLSQCTELLTVDGTISVVSFHSLEDKIVKEYFKDLCANGNFELLTRKPIVPEQREIESNPRSRSAKLRIIKRIKT